MNQVTEKQKQQLMQVLGVERNKPPSTANTPHTISQRRRSNTRQFFQPASQMGLNTSNTDSQKPTVCEHCHGLKFYRMDVPRGHPKFGKAIPCASCTDFLAQSRLNEIEQQTTVADIEPRPGEDPNQEMHVLRHAIEQLLTRNFGWFAVCGEPGTAKTLAGHALVATAARSGTQAQIWSAKEIKDRIFKGEPIIEKLSKIPVLWIDEMDKPSYKELMMIDDLIDNRHRGAMSMMTITGYSMNKLPHQWNAVANGEDIRHIVSRFVTGFNHIPWQAPGPTPPNLKHIKNIGPCIPTLFKLTVKDMRPHIKPPTPIYPITVADDYQLFQADRQTAYA